MKINYKALIILIILFSLLILLKLNVEIENKKESMRLNEDNSFQYNDENGYSSSKIYFSNKIKSEKQAYTRNKEFLINNNIAQYSTYIIFDNETFNYSTYRVEGFLLFNRKYIKDFGTKDNFTCILKLNNKIDVDEIIEINPEYSPKFYFNDMNKKIICRFNESSFSNKSSFDIKNIVVAIVWKYDYDKILSINSFETYLNITKASSQSKNHTLPFSLIKYQIPDIIYPIEPRLPSVSVCVHFTYKLPSQLINWIDMHFDFGYKEIMFYDGSDNKNLTRYLKDNYGDDERLTINPYNIELNELCNNENLLIQFNNLSNNIKQFINESCFNFFNSEFSNKFNMRENHEQLTANECFSVLSQKHEFIGYYDLDEFIFPRNLNNLIDFNNKSNYYSPKTVSSICSLSPFTNNYLNKKELENNHIYNYLYYLIELKRNKRDIQKLCSVSFSHGIYIKPNYVEKQLLIDLNEILKKNYSLSLNEVTVILRESLNKNGHTFIIKNEDLKYIEYLYNSYINLIPEIYNNYLMNINEFYDSFKRYVFYITEGNERIGKAIHYYKNVKGLFVHWASDVKEGCWSAAIRDSTEHFLQHFRHDDSRVYSGNFKGTVRKLSIDYEYIFYLLKKYTKFCYV